MTERHQKKVKRRGGGSEWSNVISSVQLGSMVTNLDHTSKPGNVMAAKIVPFKTPKICGNCRKDKHWLFWLKPSRWGVRV